MMLVTVRLQTNLRSITQTGQLVDSKFFFKITYKLHYIVH